MAEYIAKEQIKYHRERVLNRWIESRHTDFDANYKDIVTKEDIDNIAPADVIERAKIDKAIEEIENASTFDYKLHLTKTEVIRKEVVLEILKRNIGK